MRKGRDWLENVAATLGVWALYEGDLSWHHDPEDRYGGHVNCSRYGVTVFVNFDQERKTLEIHQIFDYMYNGEHCFNPPLANRERESATIENLTEKVSLWLTDAYRIHCEWAEQGKRLIDEETSEYSDRMRARADEWRKNEVPGVHQGRVLENTGFSGVISCHGLALNMTAGDRVWVFSEKPEADRDF